MKVAILWLVLGLVNAAQVIELEYDEKSKLHTAPVLLGAPPMQLTVRLTTLETLPYFTSNCSLCQEYFKAEGYSNSTSWKPVDSNQTVLNLEGAAASGRVI